MNNIRLNCRRTVAFYNYMRLRQVVTSVPLYINIDLTNSCNYRCPMCPQSNPESIVKRGNISMELFRKILADLKVIMPIEVLCLFLAGEPLMKKDAVQYVKLVYEELGIRPHIASNVALMTEEKARELIEAGIGSVLVDFCADKDIFEERRKGASWDSTYENLRMLIRVKKELDSKYPEIVLKDISTGEGNDSIDYQRLASLKALFHNGEIEKYQKYKFHNWGGLINENDHEEEKDDNSYYPCSHLWFNFAIQYDGKVSACCRDSEGVLIVGDVNEKSIRDIWNDTPLMNLRRSLLNREYKDIPLCSDCDRLWTGGYFGGSPMSIIKRWFKQSPGGFRFFSGK